MLLAIDIGNSNIVLACVKDTIIKTSRINTHPFLQVHEYQKLFLDFMTDVNGVIVSSVVPSIDNTIKESIKNAYHQECMFVTPECSEIEVLLDNPSEIGSDLLTTAVGALAKYNHTSIIVDLGTATKFTAVTIDKKFLGGSIAPGIHSSFKSIFSSAEKLEEIEIIKPSKVVETSTLACISSGMVFGYASMVDGMVERIKKEVPDALVILTGGLAPLIKEYLTIEYIYDEHILIEGLKDLYLKNR